MGMHLCELCQNKHATDTRFGVGMCADCCNIYGKAIAGEAEYVELFSNPANFSKATSKARRNIINAVVNKNIGTAEVQKRKEKEKIDELHRQDFAKSFGEFYEYDVVTIFNEGHGRIDRDKMLYILRERAQQGWKLHTIYSNELGKNALSMMGFGVNSTACEDVLIFERRVEKI